MCFRNIFGLDCFCVSLRTPITPAMFSMEELVALGGGSPSDEGGASPSLQELIELGDPGATPEPWDDIVPQEDAQASDLMELVQLGEPPCRKFKNRSWEHAQHAVSGKKLKAAEDRATMAEAACKRMGKSLALVQHLYPRFKALLRKTCPDDLSGSTAKAMAMSLIAFAPSIKGKDDRRFFQDRSVATIANVALRLQQGWIDQQLKPSAADLDASSCSTGIGLTPTMKVITWQWDETTQRIRGMLSRQAPGEKLSYAKAAAQIMMQSGQVSVHSLSGREARLVSRQPWLCRGLMLAEQTADFLLEGMAQQMPFFFDDMAAVDAKLGASPCVILSLCCDRASANFKACAWLWAQISKPPVGRRLLPHLEPCALHGVHLVKCRPSASRDTVAATSTLSALMRQWRFTTGMRDAIFQHVSSVLRVECAPRPEALRARAEEVIDALWGHEQQPWLYHITADGCIAPKELLLDLQNMAAAVDFGYSSSPHDCITHYCCVVEGSAEHAAGSRVGSPCCSGRAESVEKVSVALVNWICHRAWDQVAASRWTKVGISLRKVLSAFKPSEYCQNACVRCKPAGQSMRGSQLRWRAWSRQTRMIFRPDRS